MSSGKLLADCSSTLGSGGRSSLRSAPRNLATEAPPGVFERISFGLLDITHLEAVVALETLCYEAPWSRKLIEEEFSKQERALKLGLFLDEKLIAYSFNHLVADDLHVLNVALAPIYHGQGLGTRLLACVLSLACKKGAKQAFLEVRVSNQSARTMYRKLGFQVIGTRKAYYRNNGEDALLLQLSELDTRLQSLEKIASGWLRQ